MSTPPCPIFEDPEDCRLCATDLCPHCHTRHDGDGVVCADRAPWTTAEKDAWRAQARRRYPAIRFILVHERDRLLGASSGTRR